MSELTAFWLGIVQGLTEFLPVSSSGHLVIFQQLLGRENEGGLLIEVALHVGTLFAIVIFYHRRLISLARDTLSGDWGAWCYVGKLVVATLPAVLVGLTLKDLVQAQFDAPGVVGFCLLLTGCILWTTRWTAANAQAEEPSWLAALLIGCSQAFAILPGISRSGTTVAVGMALGVRADKAAEFSFLMGIIAITGAAVLMVPEVEGASNALMTSIVIGSVAALVSGVGAIWLFIKLLRSKSFHLFSYYTWIAGAAFLTWVLTAR